MKHKLSTFCLSATVMALGSLSANGQTTFTTNNTTQDVLKKNYLQLFASTDRLVAPSRFMALEGSPRMKRVPLKAQTPRTILPQDF